MLVDLDRLDRNIARMRQVILTEETDWVGGQLTQQAVPPDEHPWIESFGATRSYRHLRDGIRCDRQCGPQDHRRGTKDGGRA